MEASFAAAGDAASSKEGGAQAPPSDSAVFGAKMVAMLAAADSQSVAGDEKAKALAMQIQGAIEELNLHLESYDKGTSQGGVELPKDATPATNKRSGTSRSRSPRKDGVGDGLP